MSHIHDLTDDLLKDELKLSNYEYFFKYLNTYRIEKEQLDNRKFNVFVLVEKKYIDKFYLKDYSKYYVESFKPEGKFTERIHFFLSEGNKDQFIKNFNKIQLYGYKKDIDNINEQYLGHIVKKPIKNHDGLFLIGRTNLKPYPKDVPNKIKTYRRFITYSNKFSLFGIDLNIRTLPFHQQDIAVGACASAALWVTQFAIKNFHSIPIRSLAEITERGKFWYDLPTYPNEGLKIDELCKYITDIGLPFHIIEIEELYDNHLEKHGKRDASKYISSLIENVITAYLPARIPIICLLHLQNEIRGKYLNKIIIDDYHAAVISGYREENNRVSELYLHDDQIGPYCKTKTLKPMIYLDNKWNEKYNKIIISAFLIPIDPLIKLSFTNIFKNSKKITEELKKNKYNDYWIYLSHISKYKSKLLPMTVKNCMIYDSDNNKLDLKKSNKEGFLLSSFPKYIWIIRFFDNNDAKQVDVILDSTSTLWQELARIYY